MKAKERLSMRKINRFRVPFSEKMVLQNLHTHVRGFRGHRMSKDVGLATQDGLQVALRTIHFVISSSVNVGGLTSSIWRV